MGTVIVMAMAMVVGMEMVVVGMEMERTHDSIIKCRYYIRVFISSTGPKSKALALRI